MGKSIGKTFSPGSNIEGVVRTPSDQHGQVQTPTKRETRASSVTVGIKPLFDRGAKIYAAWLPDKERNTISWFPGTIKDVETSGPHIYYSVTFDDGDELDRLEEEYIMSKEDFKIKTKKELKPLFEEGDEVYAAYWKDEDDKKNCSWYPGKIKGRQEVDNRSEYGSTRLYCVQFDDGDELDGIEDCYVFNKEDYLLTMRCSGGLSNWIGVKNVVDEQSKDSWANLVGWYTANINGEEQPFSFLSDALRAYDDHVISSSDRKVKKTELNLPNERDLLKQNVGGLKRQHGETGMPQTKNSTVVSELQVGSRIYVRWPRDGNLYKATVKNLGVENSIVSKVTVQYDGRRTRSDVLPRLVEGFIEEEEGRVSDQKVDPAAQTSISSGNVSLLFELSVQSAALREGRDDGNVRDLLAESNSILKEALELYKKQNGTTIVDGVVPKAGLLEEFKAALFSSHELTLARDAEQAEDQKLPPDRSRCCDSAEARTSSPLHEPKDSHVPKVSANEESSSNISTPGSPATSALTGTSTASVHLTATKSQDHAVINASESVCAKKSQQEQEVRLAPATTKPMGSASTSGKDDREAPTVKHDHFSLSTKERRTEQYSAFGIAPHDSFSSSVGNAAMHAQEPVLLGSDDTKEQLGTSSNQYDQSADFGTQPTETLPSRRGRGEIINRLPSDDDDKACQRSPKKRKQEDCSSKNRILDASADGDSLVKVANGPIGKTMSATIVPDSREPARSVMGERQDEKQCKSSPLLRNSEHRPGPGMLQLAAEIATNCVRNDLTNVSQTRPASFEPTVSCKPNAETQVNSHENQTNTVEDACAVAAEQLVDSMDSAPIKKIMRSIESLSSQQPPHMNHTYPVQVPQMMAQPPHWPIVPQGHMMPGAYPTPARPMFHPQNGMWPHWPPRRAAPVLYNPNSTCACMHCREETNDRPISLNCGHAFCSKCWDVLSDWGCPFCRGGPLAT